MPLNEEEEEGGAEEIFISEVCDKDVLLN
jgi:hypothetical protein